MARRVQAQLKPEEFEAASPSLSQRIWGLDWTRETPAALTESIRIEYKNFAAAQPLLKKLLPAVYQTGAEPPRFGERETHGFKDKYFEAVGDFFAFYEGDTNVGMAIGTLLDWSSYNFRNIAIAPSHQNLGLYPLFFEWLAAVLKKQGVARIEGDVAPTNRHHIHALNKMGYIVTSMTYGERWGVLLHITKYLREEDEQRIGELFSTTHVTDAAANRTFKGKPRSQA